MMHGYVPEIYNPHRTVKLAYADEGAMLEAAGYTKGSELPMDPDDPDQRPRHFYVLKGVGLNQYNSGAVSLSSLRSKGSKMYSDHLNMSPGQVNAQMDANKQAAIKRMFQDNPNYDPAKAAGNYAVPVVNPQGLVTEYRYMMVEDNKDVLMDRDNQFENVLGTMAGAIFDKPSAIENNKVVMQALKEDYDENFSNGAYNYLEVSATSRDPEMRDLWKMLPDKTKEDVKEIWGNERLFVRKDSVDIIFGYRKESLGDWFEKNQDNTKGWERLVIAPAQAMLELYASQVKNMPPAQAKEYSRRLANYVTMGERGWQEIMKEIKDVIVIRNLSTLIGNLFSNITLLHFEGVPFKEIVANTAIASKAVNEYQRDYTELVDLDIKLSADTFNSAQERAEAQKRVAVLTDSLSRNPVKKLIDEGLLPTIVEDLSMDEDIYSYKSLLKSKLDSTASKIPQGLRTATNWTLMNRGTPLHQGLTRITQYSDFTARYVMYQHLTQRKENPLSHDEAIQRASEAFVNYDIPMQRHLQYMDDMGILMFMKYFLRIQKVLARMLKEHPARMLTGVALDNFVGLGPSVLEGGFISHIGNNPLNTGILQGPGIIDEIATVNGAMSLVK